MRKFLTNFFVLGSADRGGGMVGFCSVRTPRKASEGSHAFHVMLLTRRCYMDGKHTPLIMNKVYFTRCSSHI